MHQKNQISFSYARQSLTLNRFQAFMDSRTEENYPQMITEDRSAYLHFVKNNTYWIDEKNNTCYTNCSSAEIARTYFQFNEIYFYLMKHLSLNCFGVSDSNLDITKSRMLSVSSSFRHEYSVEGAYVSDTYYKVIFKDGGRPLYLNLQSNLFDHSGNKKSLLDIAYRLGTKRILGLNDKNEITSREIQKILHLDEDQEPVDFLDTPFYEILLEQTDGPQTILMENVFVSLD